MTVSTTINSTMTACMISLRGKLEKRPTPVQKKKFGSVKNRKINKKKSA